MMKIAVAQLNPIVGDLDGNMSMMLNAYLKAVADGAELVVMPECVLTGYPLEDLVLRKSFMQSVVERVDDFMFAVRDTGHTASVIFGTPYPHDIGKDVSNFDEGVENVAFLYDPTDFTQMVSKHELPNYGVFDEKRIFKQGAEPETIQWRGYYLGLMICEDAWFPTVSKKLLDSGATLLISINGSPYEVGKNLTRRNVIKERIAETHLPFLYVNLVGGQDELVFDGGSFFYDGKVMQESPDFKEGVFVFTVGMVKGHIQYGNIGHMIGLENYPTVEPTGIESIYHAAVVGTRDYMRKQGFKSVVLGYSGGVDSGIVAAIACDAVGPKNVNLVRLPSKFSSQGSLDDAGDGAQRLGAPMRTIFIEDIVDALRDAYSSSYFDTGVVAKLTGVADENIQARARGNILMAISNQEGHLLLTTGNKSEVSVGYSTLYGDMSGGFNPIKDCYKVTVWDLCRWRNSLPADQIKAYGFLGNEAEVVPEAIIVKPPSAELRPDQKDEDSLPPYQVLDAMLKGMIEDELSVEEVAAKIGQPVEAVLRIRRLVDNAEYKRRQAAPGVKITPKLFGRDRRYPIVNRWRG